MKNKIGTAIGVLLVLFPWSILPLRAYTQWAMVYAHILIPCYAALMVASGMYSILVYTVGKVRNRAMQVCLVINTAYGIFGMAVLGRMLTQP